MCLVGALRELEDELERVRSFYSSKIEDIQRKHAAQIRAMKRGEHVDDASATATDAATGGGSDGAASAGLSRMELMETELLTTAGDLGKAKKLLMEKSSELEELRLVNRQQLDQIGQLQQMQQFFQAQAMQLHSRPAASEAAALHEMLDGHSSELASVQRQAREREDVLLREARQLRDLLVEKTLQLDQQKDDVYVKLRAEETKNDRLALQVDQLQHMSRVPNSPQLEHFAVSEHASSAAIEPHLLVLWLVPCSLLSASWWRLS